MKQVFCFLISSLLGSQAFADYDSLQHNEANALVTEGRLSQAQQMYRQLLESSKSDKEEVFLLSDLANSYLHQHEYYIAVELLGLAIEKSRAFDDLARDVRYTDLLFRKSVAEARLQNNLAAIIGFDEVRNLMSQHFGVDDPRSVSVVLDIGDLYLNIGNPSKASSFFDEARSMIPAGQTQNHYRLAIGSARYHFAMEQYDQALKILAEVTTEEHPEVKPFIARCLAKSGKPDSAKVLLESSLISLENRFGSMHSLVLQTRMDKAETNWILGNFSDAAEELSLVFETYLRLYEVFYFSLSNQQRMNKVNQLGELREKIATLAHISPTRAIRQILLKTSIAFNDMPIYPSHLPESQEYKDWVGQLEKLWKAFQNIDVDEGYRRETSRMVKDINRQKQSFVKKGLLREQDATYVPPSITQIRDRLDDHQKWLEILRFRKYEPAANSFTDSVFYAYQAISKNNDSIATAFNRNGYELENKYLTYYRSSIKHRFIDDYAYLNYWGPIKPLIGDYTDLIVTPDGAYVQINLNTLRNPESKKYVRDEVNLRLVTGTTGFFKSQKNRKAANRSVYIFGNPDYTIPVEKPGQDKIGLITSEASIAGMHYIQGRMSEHHQWSELLYRDDLKQSEAGLLEALYASSGFTTHVFESDSASEQVLKNLTGPFTLHLSLHGYFMENDNFNPRVYQENRMLRSGLLLSGSDHFLNNRDRFKSMNDGILTAYEIYSLALDGTELVYLSSCETGIGIVPNSRSIKLLEKAFMHSGAESLILTIWTTETEYEIEFMNLFYYYWLFEDKSKRAAFKLAQDHMKNTYERPYYWGAFILLGE